MTASVSGSAALPVKSRGTWGPERARVAAGCVMLTTSPQDVAEASRPGAALGLPPVGWVRWAGGTGGSGLAPPLNKGVSLASVARPETAAIPASEPVQEQSRSYNV